MTTSVANKRFRRKLDRDFDTFYEEKIMGEPLSYESLVEVREFTTKSVLETVYERLSEIYPMRDEIGKKELLKLINEVYKEI